MERQVTILTILAVVFLVGTYSKEVAPSPVPIVLSQEESWRWLPLMSDLGQEYHHSYKVECNWKHCNETDSFCVETLLACLDFTP